MTAEDAGVFHWLNMRGEAALAEEVDFSKKVFFINSAEFAWYTRSSEYTSTLQVLVYDRKSLSLPLTEYNALKNEIEGLKPGTYLADEHYKRIQKVL